MKKSILLGLLVFNSLAVAGDVDLSLEIDFSAFAGGITINKTADFTVTVTNNGPDDLLLSDGPVAISSRYNYVTSDANSFQFRGSVGSSDPACEVIPFYGSPPPPINNYSVMLAVYIHRNIPANSSVSCDLYAAINELKSLDTLWQFTPRSTDIDPDESNNSQQFTFRGLVMPVPANNKWALLLLAFILVTLTIGRFKYSVIRN